MESAVFHSDPAVVVITGNAGGADVMFTELWMT